MADKTSDKRKWTQQEVQQWYLDKKAFTYHNPKDLNIFVKKQGVRG